jgi:chromosome segregation protein
LERQIEQLQERQGRLREESHAIEVELRGEPADALRSEALELDGACEEMERALSDTEQEIRSVRNRREELVQSLDAVRGNLQNSEARLGGLRELQEAAEARNDEALSAWLRRHRLDGAPRLAGLLTVEAGWERAVERVFGINLTAVCVTGMDTLPKDAEGVKSTPVTLFDLDVKPAAPETKVRGALLEKIKTNLDLAPLLEGVYVAESYDAARPRRRELAPNESIVTRDGIWMGRNWISFGGHEGDRAGWLERKHAIEGLEPEVKKLRGESEALQIQMTQLLARLEESEAERDDTAHGLNEKHRQRAQLREKLGQKQERLAQLELRRTQILREQGELSEQINLAQTECEEAGIISRNAQSDSERHEARRVELVRSRDAVRAELEQARAAETQARERMHRLEIERQALQTAFESTRASITRLEGQLQHLSERRTELQRVLAEDKEPDAELRQRLDGFLERRLEIEARLNQAREAVSALETELRAQEQERARHEKSVQEVRERMEGERVARQELLVRRDTLAEQVRESGFDLHELLKTLPEEADEASWQAECDRVAARIDRLGPINLVAIDEYQEQSERKNYLDKQYEDLSQALATLAEAMRKIDRETRTRFKQTFDSVNENFQNFFPRLFGGGSAYLELTEDDLLETGVTVMARPPGKRNSTIHLLSGGEKALTAVGLLFAIFELNPAPFCLLDEVDAPLDDANVERYCDTIKTLSARSQLVYVTHNKISMEMANALIGVTMSEPGVSRLVAVDVEEALQMAAQ